MNVLVIAAHPDDEVLGCGATAARLVREGHNVQFAIMAEGITSRYERREAADLNLVEELRSHALIAARTIGVKDVHFYQFPDNRMDSVPLLEVVKKVEEIVERVRPARIYTHHPGDLNVDHGTVSRAVMTATRPMPGCPASEVLYFEVPSSTEWAFQAVLPIFRPNVFVDVRETLQAKLDAMACYETEVRAFPHPRSPEALRVNARRWGTVIGREAAEAFELARMII